MVFLYLLRHYERMSLPVFSHIFNSTNLEVGLIEHGWTGVDSRQQAESKAMTAVVCAAKMIESGKISTEDVARIDVEDTGWRKIYSFTRDELVEVCQRTVASRPDWTSLHAACPIVLPEMQ